MSTHTDGDEVTWEGLRDWPLPAPGDSKYSRGQLIVIKSEAGMLLGRDIDAVGPADLAEILARGLCDELPRVLVEIESTR